MMPALHFLPPAAALPPGTAMRPFIVQPRTMGVIAAVAAVHALALWGLHHLGQRPPAMIAPPVVQAELVPAMPEQTPAPRPAPAAVQRPIQPPPKRMPAQRPTPTPTTTPEPATAAPADPEPVPSTNESAASNAAVLASAAPAPAAPPAPPAPPPQIELPSASAAYLNNPPPPYPALSRRLGEQGRVVVRVRIEPDGTASAAEIRTSSGYARLDEAALAAVRQWRYVPGKRNGVPEAMWFLVPIQFELR